MEDHQDSQESGTGPSFNPTGLDEEFLSHLQRLTNNPQPTSQTGEHLGYNMQPVRNLQFDSQTVEHHGYIMQPRRNLQPQRNLLSNGQTVQHRGSHFIPPNQPGTSSYQRQRLHQSDHMIPSIGNQLGSAYPYLVVQCNPLSSSYELQQSAPQPVTNFSPASFQSQGGNVNPNIWNIQQHYYDLIRREAEMDCRIANLYQSNNRLQSQLNYYINQSRLLEEELSNLKQSQRQMDDCQIHYIRRLEGVEAELNNLKEKSQGQIDDIRMLKAELNNLKQSHGQMANDIRHISEKASEKNISGKSIPSDDTMPSTGIVNSHLGGGRAFLYGGKISDSYKLEECNPLVQSGSGPCSSSGVKIKAGEQSKGPVNVAAREGLSATAIHRDEFTTELCIIQGEKENAYTSKDGNTWGFPS